MVKCAVLITIFNRLDITINCLDSFYECIKTIDYIQFDIFINNDGSPKHTNILKEKYKNIIVLQSNGNLYWNRGMINVWTYAKKDEEYSFYILLNDDVFLFPHAIEILFSNFYSTKKSPIISGAFKSKKDNKITYGGRDCNYNLVTPNGILQKIKYLNCNCTLIPIDIVKAIGIFDRWFHHGNGDFDYGFRAQKKLFDIFLSSEIVGYCEQNDGLIAKCFDNSVKISKRIKFLYSPKGPNPFINFRLYSKHFSIFEALKFIFISHFRTLLPRKKI